MQIFLHAESGLISVIFPTPREGCEGDQGADEDCCRPLQVDLPWQGEWKGIGDGGGYGDDDGDGVGDGRDGADTSNSSALARSLERLRT